MTEAVWVAIIGLGTGALGSLVAPWAQWGVEKRRERLAHRRALIASWREGIVAWQVGITVIAPKHPTTPKFVSTPWFLSLRPNLAPSDVEYLTAVLEPAEPDDRRRDLAALGRRLREEVDRLESEWGLT